MRGKEVRSACVVVSLRITPACAGKRIRSRLPDPVGGDHPRMCGEKGTALPAHSPPGGITPACAGKSTSASGSSQCQRDHPRVCGEKLGHTIDHLHTAGSPPRVRGKVVHYIPICCAFQDHPRVCGEKLPATGRRCPGQGSPPRVRGKAPFLCYAFNNQGITPACAGKRRHAAGLQRHQRDHPRVCGEKFTREKS